MECQEICVTDDYYFLCVSYHELPMKLDMLCDSKLPEHDNTYILQSGSATIGHPIFHLKLQLNLAENAEENVLFLQSKEYSSLTKNGGSNKQCPNNVINWNWMSNITLCTYTFTII